jgi:hypothetical protein
MSAKRSSRKPTQQLLGITRPDPGKPSKWRGPRELRSWRGAESNGTSSRNKMTPEQERLAWLLEWFQKREHQAPDRNKERRDRRALLQWRKYSKRSMNGKPGTNKKRAALSRVQRSRAALLVRPNAEAAPSTRLRPDAASSTAPTHSDDACNSHDSQRTAPRSSRVAT